MKQGYLYLFANEETKSKKLYFIFILVLIIILININMYGLAKIPILRVGIFIDYNNVSIKSENGFQVKEKSSGKDLLIIDGNKNITISANEDGIIIDNQFFPSIDEIKLIPKNGEFLQVEERKYRGEIEIIKNNTLINVINIIGIEQYLYGVLKKEISPEWPEEALKAQAIAARTFALSNMNKYLDNGYNICATTNSQAYGGLYHEHPATNKAVDDTSGIVATYQGEPINAVYHSDSGGFTENSEDVWGGFVPYLRSVQSDFEEIVSPPNHQWECSLSEQDIISRLAQKGHKMKDLKDIIISEKTNSGRVVSVDIINIDDQKINLKGNEFRLLIDPTLIRSSLFKIDKIGEIEDNSENNIITSAEEQKYSKPDSTEKTVREILDESENLNISELIILLGRPKEEKKVTKVVKETIEENVENNKNHSLIFSFSGKGSGHGVGLSQWGAYGMATKGYGYEDILKYYYQQIKLAKIY